jgi:hexosaminidase
MKNIFLIFLFFGLTVRMTAQIKLPILNDSLFSTYYQQRVSHFKLTPLKENDIVFIGNSITDGAEWAELFNDITIKNRGISGDFSSGILHRINDIVKQNPRKIFLLIGVNDLARGISTDSVIKNILLTADWIKQENPSTQLFIQSILPVSDVFKKFSGHTNKTDSILRINSWLKKESENHRYNYIDLHTFFCNKQGKLDVKYTNDGLHLLGEGYILWKHLVFPYIYSIEEKPSIIPLPQKLTWHNGYFQLHLASSIIVNDAALAAEARFLKEMIEDNGTQLEIKNKVKDSEVFIELQLKKNDLLNAAPESYSLKVSENKILLSASSAQGIFNGIQTLRQLMRDGAIIDACEISDQPAFSWRGYMIDVGRNYMSMKLLKEQIDVMARYKLNVFHFHATEDIAWRIAIKQYPQLTAPENMLRNKGQYYAESEIQELIAYCKERHITFVPEIDMPGHSAAFKRAMKTDMQSDSGITYVKNILKEFCSTYDVPYIHIGADEVKITNKKFIPEVTAYIESLGKKVIGWQPGGNFNDNTIRQLWMDDNSHLNNSKNIQYIDSRHLYLNHMDPLESVVTIFNRKICEKEKGDSAAIGATLCMWHDRAIGREEDILTMNPVYPGLLAFAERTWRGGGQSGWIANMDDGDVKLFANFESRLLENKKLYFKSKPFPYVKQTNIFWNLYGPYFNGGDLSKAFEVESLLWQQRKKQPVKQITGGTIVLKHWWAPLIKGAVDKPKENTTWYANTTIWSDEEVTKEFWIGFNNISRSPASDSPPKDGWDNKGSTVWVNGKLILPPVWKRPGQKGNAEIPLIDEGYEYRTPTKIKLQKGFNTVLLKLPVGSFKAKDWQNPVKWMFTFVEVNKE